MRMLMKKLRVDNYIGLVAASSVPGGVKIQSAYDESALGRFIFYSAPSVYEQVRKLAGSDVDVCFGGMISVTLMEI